MTDFPDYWHVRDKRWEEEDLGIEIDTGKRQELRHLKIAICPTCRVDLIQKWKRHQASDGYKYMSNYICPSCKEEFVVPGPVPLNDPFFKDDFDKINKSLRKQFREEY